MIPGDARFCRPEAIADLERHLPTLDQTDSLVAGAVAIVRHEYPDVCELEVREQLAEWAVSIRERTDSQDPRSLLSHAHAVLFDELGFGRGLEHYLDPAASYLSAVIQRRRGLPILISLVYKSVLEGIGLTVRGIGAPGHFLVEVDCGGRAMLVDPFNAGTPLSSDEAFARSEEALGRSIERQDAWLRPVTNHMWLFRILNNLEICFSRCKRPEDQVAMRELKGLLYRGPGSDPR